MVKKRTSFSAQTRESAVQRVFAGEKRSDVAKSLGASLTTLNNWVTKAGGTRVRATAQGSTSDASGTEELWRLEREYLRKKVELYERKFGAL